MVFRAPKVRISIHTSRCYARKSSGSAVKWLQNDSPLSQSERDHSPVELIGTCIEATWLACRPVRYH